MLTEDQHHTLKSLVGPVEEFLVVIILCLFISLLPLLYGGNYLVMFVCLSFCLTTKVLKRLLTDSVEV